MPPATEGEPAGGTLKDYIEGRVSDRVWLHRQVSDAGIPALEHRTPPPPPLCPLCALAGRGDGIPDLHSLAGNI